jgi:hypothetical protein
MEIACLGNQCCQASRDDRNPVNATLKYIGVLRSIMRVHYASTKINVMKCAWVKPNVMRSRKMKMDDHGF